MIRFLERMTPELRDELQAFCAGSVFGVKALGPVLSYGLGYNFVTAWEQRDEAGHLTAFLSKYYGTVTVHLSPLGDVPEVHAFSGPSASAPSWARPLSSESTCRRERPDVS